MDLATACRPLIAAHRGAWGPEPRNSLAAFRRAMGLGVEMIELDVRTICDGRPVVVHDPEVSGFPVDGLDWGDLAALDPSVPLLEEVLRLCAGRVLLDIEIKVEGAEEAVLDLIRRHPPGGFVVSSFLPGALAGVRRRDARFVTGLVADTGEAEALAAFCRFEGHAALFMHHSILPSPGRCAGVDLYAWTVNGVENLGAALGRGDLAGILTDEPGPAMALRASLPQTRYNEAIVMNMSPGTT
jgi:glycerophosphoryl diester phosphodiesterase